MKNITLALAAGVIPALPAAAAKPQQQAPPVRPNIIHIMTDDHSFQTISAYGHPISKVAPTPNIDRLAARGMLFTRAFVENSISSPSRATLLTGKYSHINGQTAFGDGFICDQITFPLLLQQAGYQTAVFGKWHLNCDPRGFDKWSVLNDQGDYYNPEFKSESSGGRYVREEGYCSTLITDHSLRWLEGRDPSKPFCLLVHHKAPHRNWMPDTKYLDLYEDVEIPYPATLFDDYATRSDAARTQEMTIARNMMMGYDLKVPELLGEDDMPWAVQDWNRGIGRMTPEQRAAWDAAYGPRNRAMLEAHLAGDDLTRWKYQRYLKDYLRCIKSVDDQVGRLLDYLEGEGLMDNTIIVYCSDQGFYMGEHGWYDKRFMYEESLRTPLIISYPASMMKQGVVCDKIVQNIDFAPTYIALGGVDIPLEINGISLLPLFSGNGKAPKGWRDEIYYHYYDFPAIHMVRRHDGVRTERYKLIHFYGRAYPDRGIKAIDAWEFYDLQRDPQELDNLYGDPRYRKQIADMHSRLERKRAEVNIKE